MRLCIASTSGRSVSDRCPATGEAELVGFRARAGLLKACAKASGDGGGGGRTFADEREHARASAGERYPKQSPHAYREGLVETGNLFCSIRLMNAIAHCRVERTPRSTRERRPE